jgi:hypothetical protein
MNCAFGYFTISSFEALKHSGFERKTLLPRLAIGPKTSASWLRHCGGLRGNGFPVTAVGKPVVFGQLSKLATGRHSSATSLQRFDTTDVRITGGSV